MYAEQIKSLVDDLKGICQNNWLGWDANEYKIVTQSFLYKFLNDKFLHEIQKVNPGLQGYEDIKKLSDNDYNILLMKIWVNSAKLKAEHLLTYLFEHQNDDDIAKKFDETLNDIAVQNTSIFSVHTGQNTDIRLFEETLIQSSVSDKQNHNKVARGIINKLINCKFDFNDVFNQWFDFFSTIFEYMIKDYNKDGGGKYAEYYTPHSVAKVIAKILIWDEKVENVKVYDPAAGSGTLLMNLANEIWVNKCTIYSQDINQKSTNLLRLNLILNNLTHSINHIVQWNTILESRHKDKMDFIVSNPPFKLDFSEWRDEVEQLPNSQERFFAGVPKIKEKDKDKMEIYLLFIQHIIYSLSDTWKAAIVVPTGFIAAQNWIEKKIRERIIDKNRLRWVVSMPSNIFATTNTNVSVMFVDKNRGDNDEVILIDASGLWETIKEWKNKKTFLRDYEQQKIIDTFRNMEVIEDFSVKVTNEQIKEKNYSWQAGQYFGIKIEHIDITAEEFDNKMNSYKQNLKVWFEEWRKLEDDIFNQLNRLNYD